MEECCCCCESTPGRDRCPRCGQTGMAVKKITVKTPMPLVRHQQKDENKRAGICLEQALGPRGPAALAKPRSEGGAEDRKSEAGL